MINTNNKPVAESSSIIFSSSGIEELGRNRGNMKRTSNEYVIGLTIIKMEYL